MKWQPMEKMPSDSKVYLVHTPGSHRGIVDVGFKDLLTGEIRVQSSLGWEPLKNFGGTATGFMPFPEPPHD